MKLAEKTCGDFIATLAGKSPVPGGGGASALVGAVGTALGNMVGSLTAGKKKYADVEADIVRLQRTADKLQAELLALIDKDAEDFEPLAKAYGLPGGTDAEKTEKAAVMEKCLKNACATPFEIMRKCCEGIACCEEFGAKGSRLALSDAGVGVAFCKAALQGASLNVFINTKAMTDRAYADKINAEAISLLEEYSARADKAFKSVAEQLRA